MLAMFVTAVAVRVSAMRFTVMRVTMVRFRELCLVAMFVSVMRDGYRGNEFVRFRNVRSRFEKIGGRAKSERLLFAAWPGRHQLHGIGRRRAARDSFAVRKIKAEDRRYSSFENAQLNETGFNCDQRPAMWTMFGRARFRTIAWCGHDSDRRYPHLPWPCNENQ